MVGRIGTLVSWYQMLIFPLVTTLASQLQLETLRVSVAPFPGPIPNVIFNVACSKDQGSPGPIPSVIFNIACSKDRGSLGTRLDYYCHWLPLICCHVQCCHTLLSIYVQITMTSLLYVSMMSTWSPKMKVQLLRYVYPWLVSPKVDINSKPVPVACLKIAGYLIT